ncbi:MAG: HIT family protein [Flavobacteriales bacterium]|jgi:histidine triad (HIT) family protein|nr:HIT family protein [Flavobacteriales bacterium]MDB9931323.1 HIT family protein [Flavobacteriales bacterium]|tara:strand:- start:2187 stop:2573 length:387 start_codon:yes stop_codon:yes gene_type:complete
MATIFTKIIEGEIPCYKIAEDDKFLAFLDISPLAKGHTLVIPKVEIDYIFDVEDNVLGEMMVFAKKVALKVEKAIPCERIGVSIIGLEVPHAHIHLVPMNTADDVNFTRAKLSLSKEEMLDVLAKING